MVLSSLGFVCLGRNNNVNRCVAHGKGAGDEVLAGG